MRIRSLILASLSVLAMTSGSFAAINGGCTDYVEVTVDNAARPYSATVKAGSATSNGYSGIPGEFGCPIKAALGTCPDRNASLSNKVDSYVGQFVAFDGNVDDIETHRNWIKIGPIKVYGPELDGACGS